MANSSSKRGRPSKAESERKQRAETRKKEKEQRAQGTAIALFAIGVVLTALTFIPGESVWDTLRNVMFGLLGICAYAIGPCVIYIAVRYAFDKLSPSGRIIKFLLLAFSVSGAFYAFGLYKPSSDTEVLTVVKFLYTLGIERKGSGVMAFPLGWLLERGCGETAAKIIIILLICVSIMLITGKTIVDLVNGVRKPIDGIKEKRRLAAEEQEDDGLLDEPTANAEIDIPLDEKATKKTERFNIDVPLDKSRGRRKKSDVDVPLDTLGQAVAPAVTSPPTSATGSKIDIPLGPEFDPKNGGVEHDPVVRRNNGPACEIVKPVFEREERVNNLFTDFSKNKETSVDELVKRAATSTAYNAPTASEGGAEFLAAEYKAPPASLLSRPSGRVSGDVTGELRSNAQLLVNALESFGVKTKVVDISRGPSVTRYELQPEAGVRLSRIVNLADDIALNLAASGVRIEAPIPGKAAVGIEIPNKEVNTVNLREVIESDEFKKAPSPLTFALGRDISGKIQLGDLTKMLHLLIAGSTGMGKSVCINSMIMSLVYKSKPEDVQLILIDPKIVEFNCYNGLPHLYVPVVTDAHKAAGALGGAVGEMLRRYKLFSEFGARNIEDYNKIIDKDYPSTRVMEDGETRPEKKPRIVIVIDELADLMMTSPHEVEDSICRLAQMGRAAGIHLVVATQRPSVDVITGVIKNNIPTRIAFAVSSQVDSRTILDGAGAEKLIGRGDMLFLPVGSPKPIRIQGCYVSEDEVNKVVGYLKQFAVASYNEQFIRAIEENATKDKGKMTDSDGDAMLEDAIEVVVEAGAASTSLLQRRLKLGYARAARIMDDMEAMGIIGPADGSKPRVVLMSRQQWQERALRIQNEE